MNYRGMTCFLDMDGVIANFVGEAIRMHGLDYDEVYPPGERSVYKMEKRLGMTESEFWAPLMGPGFWSRLKKTPEADDIVALAEEFFGEQVYILSSPNRDWGCVTGKMAWLDAYFPQFVRSRRYFFGPEKWVLAAPDKVLIDDRMDTVEKFCMAGGKGVLVPRPWNSMAGNDVAPSIRSQIESMTGLLI